MRMGAPPATSALSNCPVRRTPPICHQARRTAAWRRPRRPRPAHRRSSDPAGRAANPPSLLRHVRHGPPSRVMAGYEVISAPGGSEIVKRADEAEPSQAGSTTPMQPPPTTAPQTRPVPTPSVPRLLTLRCRCWIVRAIQRQAGLTNVAQAQLGILFQTAPQRRPHRQRGGRGQRGPAGLLADDGDDQVRDVFALKRPSCPSAFRRALRRTRRYPHACPPHDRSPARAPCTPPSRGSSRPASSPAK